jgi:hypothetical protein
MDARSLAAALALALCLAACGSTQQAAQNMRTAWVGKRADDFFARLGPAERAQRLGDGRTVYAWESSTIGPMSGKRAWCSADIVASPAGIIMEIRPKEDSRGLWNNSRCAEVF